VEHNDKTRKKSVDIPEDLAENAVVDEFFERLNSNVRRPKPRDEAVAAVVEALQRLTVQSDVEEAISSERPDREQEGNDIENDKSARLCSSCGHNNPAANKFCSACGVSLPADAQLSTASSPRAAAPQRPHLEHMPPGPHHYHHHYHHHYFSSSESNIPGAEHRQSGNAPTRDPGRLRAPAASPASVPAAMSRAEIAARKVMQDWTLACNTKQLDDLVELYHTDSMVLRPNVPPVRGTASIREFFFSVLGSGFGEVEFEPLRVEILGDVAYEAGRCKSLVPSATGKRREDRGKYLIVLLRQSAGEWKIGSDCWSSDLLLASADEPEPARGTSAAPASRGSRKDN